MNRLGIKPVRRLKRRGGMTLIEIMISMVILSYGLLGVAAIQVRAIVEGSGGQHLSTASALARNRVEALTRQDWSSVQLADTGGVWNAAVNLTPADITYAQSERITNDVGLTRKAIEVRIQWGDSKRLNRSVVLSSARLREDDE